MAVVFPCPWLHFRPKHLLKGFLEHFWVFPKLRGLLGAQHRAESRARARVQSGVLITDFKPPPQRHRVKRADHSSHLVGRDQGMPSSSRPDLLPSCLLVLCCPFLSVQVCLPAQLPGCLLLARESNSYSFTLSTSDLPSSLVAQACICRLKLQQSEQDIIH